MSRSFGTKGKGAWQGRSAGCTRRAETTRACGGAGNIFNEGADRTIPDDGRRGPRPPHGSDAALGDAKRKRRGRRTAHRKRSRAPHPVRRWRERSAPRGRGLLPHSAGTGPGRTPVRPHRRPCNVRTKRMPQFLVPGGCGVRRLTVETGRYRLRVPGEAGGRPSCRIADRRMHRNVSVDTDR